MTHSAIENYLSTYQNSVNRNHRFRPAFLQGFVQTEEGSSSSGDFRYTHSPWRLSCYTTAPAWLSGWKCLRRSISGTDHWQCDCSDAHADATAAATSADSDADAVARHANTWRAISPVYWGGSSQYESADIRYGRG
ncbi:uncharacterized protein LOC117185698 isoform X8 [Drosophila miranda]|uniref:uncharacterized protein LOC117185698 isoform X8 n=1 Tax=Drosophila miranda TaxID=7229 RepID=UPI00143F4703|nr:uncharacterized protein LOC117185698 isoform X8 [Drosophila miranda]